MSKFKSLVLFSFLCIVSQVGVSSEGVEGVSQTVSYSKYFGRNSAIFLQKKADALRLALNELEFYCPLIAPLCLGARDKIRVFKKSLRIFDICEQEDLERLESSIDKMREDLENEILGVSNKELQALEKGGRDLQFISYDAPVALDINEKIRGMRKLPGASSILDIKAFVDFINGMRWMKIEMTCMASNIAIGKLNALYVALGNIKEVGNGEEIEYFSKKIRALDVFLERKHSLEEINRFIIKEMQKTEKEATMFCLHKRIRMCRLHML